MASSTAADPAKKVSNADDPVKAGYWFCTSKFPAENINSGLFTHLYAGFAKVKCPIPQGEDINDVIQFPNDFKKSLENFPKTVRKRNPGVKALLSIGGGGPYVKPADVDKDISATIAALVAREESDELRQKFIERSIELATTCKYDGLDLCWLYPASKGYQDPQLASFLKAWGDKCKTSKLLLTATVFHHPVIPDGTTGGTNFNSPLGDISANLDWMNVLADDFYDPFTSSPSATGPVHAWLNSEDTSRCGTDGIEKWLAASLVGSEKLVLGLPFYGREWTLDNPDDNDFFAPASSALVKDKYLDFKFIQKKYYEKHPNNLRYINTYVAAYWFYQSTWIGFDEAQCISTKVQAAKGKNLRGYCAWHVGADDDKWTLSTAAFEKYMAAG